MRTRLRKQLLWYDGEGKEMAREGADAAGGEHEAADYVPRRRGWTYINSRRSSRPSREGDAHRRRRTGPITPRRRRSDLTREYYQRRRRTPYVAKPVDVRRRRTITYTPRRRGTGT